MIQNNINSGGSGILRPRSVDGGIASYYSIAAQSTVGTSDEPQSVPAFDRVWVGSH